MNLNHQKFQSRNRDTFDFKSVHFRCKERLNRGFNLVIEILLISRQATVKFTHVTGASFNLVIEILLISRTAPNGLRRFRLTMFQSRNRDTFDFKYSSIRLKILSIFCFNLVIEILLISSWVLPWRNWQRSRFNLVIEILLISSPFRLYPGYRLAMVSIS